MSQVYLKREQIHSELIEHPLWKGSLLDTALFMKALTPEMIENRIWKKAPDDATQDEITFQQELKNFVTHWWG